MFVARLICSDPVCAEVEVIEAETLGELEVLVCACGWGYDVIAWADWEEPLEAPLGADVVVLRVGAALARAA